MGLLDGKLGAVIFLLHYAKHSHIKKYESFAMELFDYIQDSLIMDNSDRVNHNAIDLGIGMNYMLSQELAEGDPDDLLEEVDTLLFSYLDRKNILYLRKRDLFAIGKYFLLRIEAAPASVNQMFHLKALNRTFEILQLHFVNVTICHPVMVKFLYRVSKVMPAKSVESLLNQQVNNYPNKTDWYRSTIPDWFNTFFIPGDNELLKGILMKEVIENSSGYIADDRSDIISGGASGLLVWFNLLHDAKYDDIKNSAIEKIISDIHNDRTSTNVSIYAGCSGIGLSLLSCIDNQCNEWINLL
jgi:hypothetical protein